MARRDAPGCLRALWEQLDALRAQAGGDNNKYSSPFQHATVALTALCNDPPLIYPGFPPPARGRWPCLRFSRRNAWGVRITTSCEKGPHIWLDQ